MDPTKPGWKTSEFWLPIAMAGLIGLLGKLGATAALAGFPPLVLGAVMIVVPLALSWLTAKYGDNRTALKLGAQALQAAALKAAPPPASAAQAVAILNAPPGG